MGGEKKNLFCVMMIFALVGISAVAEDAGAKSVQEPVPIVTKIGSYTCGKQPKQVLFSPDDKYIIMPLLGDTGFDIFSVEEYTSAKRHSRTG